MDGGIVEAESKTKNKKKDRQTETVKLNESKQHTTLTPNSSYEPVIKTPSDK